MFAKETQKGILHSGQDIVLTPKNAHALSITHASGYHTSHSNFDFTMLNYKDIIYEDHAQKDDVYLVFHDDIRKGDRIKLHVNRGHFNYKIAPINALPTIVKKALDPVVLEEVKRAKIRKKRKKRKVLLKKESLKKSELIPVQESVVVTPIARPIVYATPKAKPIQQVPLRTKSQKEKSPIGDTFFAKFTKVFKGLVASLSSSSSVYTPKPKPKPIPKRVAKPIKKFAPPVMSDDDLRQASMQRDIYTSAKKELPPLMDDKSLQREASLEQRRVFVTPQAIPANTYLPIGEKRVFKGTLSPKAPANETSLPTPHESLPSFRKQRPQLPSEVASAMLTTEKVPTFQRVTPPKPREVVYKEVAKQITSYTQDRASVVQQAQPVTKPRVERKNVTPYYPDTGYKEGYESLNQASQTLPISPSIEAKKAAHIAVVEDSTLPSNTSTSRGDDTEEKGLVIRKIIEKDEPRSNRDPFAGRVLGNMDDRVLGNGYDGATHVGKLGMRVSKNNRPVSAWIEVFKDGTKKRVKTFYTSKSRSAKSVKLPAGTYMVRATYRSRDSKQQKTVRNIHVKEGGSVTRSIAFHDGKLRVIAKRADQPLYVKVVVYKPGTHKRVSYDFSARNSGIATLSLGSGTYDVEVLEHNNNRSFSDIHIDGGKVETIHVDF